MATNCVNPTNNCCETCTTVLQSNCTCQPCSPVSVQCTADINNAVCVPILAEQIYDCINIEKEQCSYLTGVTFDIAPSAITGTVTPYTVTDPICITGVGISYDFIGLASGASGISGVTLPTNASTIIDGTTVTTTPNNVRICSGTGTAATDTTVDISLYNQSTTTISRNNSCCCGQTGTVTASKARIIERALTFWVCNLNVNVAGLIGCRTFTATSTISNNTYLNNPIPLSVPSGTFGTNFSTANTNLGFDPITFCGRLCLPVSASTINLNENFDSCLQIDCVNWDNTQIGGTGTAQTFTADVELTFLVTKQILATIQEQMAVFTTPDAVICKNGTQIGTCTGITATINAQ